MSTIKHPECSAFEAFWRETRGNRKAERDLVPHKKEPQTYVCDSANRHFVTWCAARASVSQTRPPFPGFVHDDDPNCYSGGKACIDCLMQGQCMAVC